MISLRMLIIVDRCKSTFRAPQCVAVEEGESFNSRTAGHISSLIRKAAGAATHKEDTTHEK